MIEPIKLHAYVDGELSEGERQDIESRLAECQKSQAEVAAIQGMKAMLASPSNVECEEVWASCKSRLDAIDRVARSGNFITKYSWAFVSAVALVVVIGGGYARHAQAGSVDNSALAGIFSSSSKMTPEKQSRNAELDRLLKDADQNLAKLRVVAETSGLIEGQPYRRLDLEDGGGVRFSLIVLPEVTSFDGLTPDKDGKFFYGQFENTKAVAWRMNSAALVLVGSLDHPQLQVVAKNLFIMPK